MGRGVLLGGQQKMGLGRQAEPASLTVLLVTLGTG